MPVFCFIKHMPFHLPLSFFFHSTFHVLLQVVLGSASKRVGKIRPFKNKIDYFCTAFFNQNHYNWWLRALITPLQRAPLDFARHPWLFYLLIYLFNGFYFLPWFLGHRVEANSCFKWLRLFLSGRLFFLQGLRSKHAPSFQKETKIPVIPYSRSSFSRSFFPLAPVESEIGPRVIPPDLSRAPAELRAKRSFSQVPSGGRIQRSFPPSPTHPKCSWETFQTPLKRERHKRVHMLYLRPLSGTEMWGRAGHEMVTSELWLI